MRKGLVFFVFLLVFAGDYLSKQYAISHPEVFLWNSGAGVELYLHYVENRGGAWGILAEYADYLLWFRIAAVTALVLYLLLSQQTWLRTLSLSLLISGALCNVIDFLTRGYVIDMIHFLFWEHSYGVFNVADAAIFLGVLGLIVKQKQKKKKICMSRAPSK